MTHPITILYVVGIFCSLYFFLRALPKTYLPIARPIATFSLLLSLHFMMSLMDVVSTSLHVNQFVSDYNAVFISLLIPILLWMWYEFHLNKHVNSGWFLFLLFDPLIVFSIVTYELVLSDALTPNVMAVSDLVTPYQRFGIYAPIRLIYLISLGLFLTVFACWSVYKSKRMTRLLAVTFSISLSLPFLAAIAYFFELIPFRLGGLALIGLLTWGSYHYHLLDVFPIAKNQIFNRINSGIMMFNSNKEPIYVNTFFRQLLNLPSKLIKGVVPINQPTKNLIQMFSWDSLSSQKEPVILNSEGKFLRGDNLTTGVRFFYIELEKIENKNNTTIGYILMLQEVTEQAILRKDILNKNVQLENINKNRSLFFAGISHELRTPLTLSNGHVESILNGQYDIPVKALAKPLNLIYENNQRLLAFINQLLDFSQLDGERLPIKQIQLNLNQHLASILAQFESLFQQQNIKLNLQTSADEAHILFDLQSFEKVILNVISNAIKSMPSGGDLSIEVTNSNEESWLLSITDTGFGIDKEIQENLFEPFVYREHHNQNWQRGSGVGLSLVKQILELHDGTINIKHTSSNGTCFVIGLKKMTDNFSIINKVKTNNKGSEKLHSDTYQEIESLRLNHSEFSEQPTSDGDNFIENTKNKPIVLLVDDNTDIRDLIGSQIDESYHVINATNGEHGLTLAKQLIPDIVITDIMMPIMDGLQMSKELKQDMATSHIPIIMLTAKSGNESLLEGLQSGADDFILKPFNAKELKLRLHNLIERQESFRQFYSSQFQRSNEDLHLNSTKEKESLFIETIKSYINKNISKQKIHTSELAGLVFMSERSFNRKIKALIGFSSKQLLLRLRMQYAENLLIKTTQSISTISFATGFSDTSYFSRTFKSYYSMTPKQYRSNLIDASALDKRKNNNNQSINT